MESERACCHHCLMQQELRKGLSEDGPMARSGWESDWCVRFQGCVSLVCIVCPAVDPGLFPGAIKCVRVCTCACPIVSDKGAFAFINFSYVLFGEKPHPAMRGGWLFFISQQLRVLGAGWRLGGLS